MSQRSSHYFYVVSGVLMLLIGGMVYLLCRPHTILINHIASFLGLDPFLVNMREWIQIRHLSHIWIYSLPAGLWAASYVTLVHAFSDKLSRSQRLSFAAVMPMIGTLSEVLQGMGIVPGTFDTLDIVCYIIPYLLYLAIMLFSINKHF